MPEHEEANAMTTSQTEREQEAEQREDAAPRERWGQPAGLSQSRGTVRPAS